MTNANLNQLTSFEHECIETLKWVLPTLERNVDYTSSMIIPADVWSNLSDGQRRTIGSTLSRLVDAGRVPLVKTSPRYKMPVTYQRI